MFLKNLKIIFVALFESNFQNIHDTCKSKVVAASGDATSIPGIVAFFLISKNCNSTSLFIFNSDIAVSKTVSTRTSLQIQVFVAKSLRL